MQLKARQDQDRDAHMLDIGQESTVLHPEVWRRISRPAPGMLSQPRPYHIRLE